MKSSDGHTLPNRIALVGSPNSGKSSLFNELTGKRVDCERRGPGSIVGELSLEVVSGALLSMLAIPVCPV